MWKESFLNEKKKNRERVFTCAFYDVGLGGGYHVSFLASDLKPVKQIASIIMNLKLKYYKQVKIFKFLTFDELRRGSRVGSSRVILIPPLSTSKNNMKIPNQIAKLNL